MADRKHRIVNGPLAMKAPGETFGSDELEKARRERDMYSQALKEALKRYQEKLKELSVVRRVSDSLRFGFNLEEVTCTVVDILVEEVGAENCSLMLLDTSTGELGIRAARGGGDAATTYYPADAAPDP